MAAARPKTSFGSILLSKTSFFGLGLFSLPKEADLPKNASGPKRFEVPLPLRVAVEPFKPLPGAVIVIVDDKPVPFLLRPAVDDANPRNLLLFPNFEEDKVSVDREGTSTK